MKYTQVPTEEIYIKSGEYIRDRIQTLLNEGRKVLLLASGGSAINSLQPLANWLNKFPESIGDRLVITLIDERYSMDIYSKESNTMQINEMIKVHIDDVHEIGLVDLMENSGGYKGIYERINHGAEKQDEVNLYNQFLENFLNSDEYTKIAIYGIGDDSHISGILPYPDDQAFFDLNFNSISLAAGYEVKDDRNPYKDRITMTLTAMKKMDEAIVVISGENKKKALEKALNNGIEKVSETPASVLKEMRDVNVFSD